MALPELKRGQVWEVDFAPQTHKEELDLLVDQIRTIANRRIMGLKPVAEFSRAHMKRVEEALRILTSE
ncbi:MAG: hypothetical protein V4757_03310 [Pseudomonadota bacterium]